MPRSRWGSVVGNEDVSGWRGDTDGIASAQSTVVTETNSGTSWSLGTVMRGISSIGHDPSRPGACPSLTSRHRSTQCTHGPNIAPTCFQREPFTLDSGRGTRTSGRIRVLKPPNVHHVDGWQDAGLRRDNRGGDPGWVNHGSGRDEPC